MAETIDEATIIAWLDGELPVGEAARVADAVAADPVLAALAERHRALRDRFAAAFAPIAAAPVALPERGAAPVISLAAARAARAAKPAPSPRAQWWGLGGAIAASLLVGVAIGGQIRPAPGVADRPGALALSPGIARALDSQLSGEAGAVRVALSFRDRAGQYCRDFAGASLSGVACRAGDGWQLRYATPAATPVQASDYRMAGTDAARAEMVSAMIAGDPLDRAGEQAARKAGWR